MLPFFATSRVSGLASIVTATKFSKIFVGAEPPYEVSGGGGLKFLSSSILYACGRSNKVDEVVNFFLQTKIEFVLSKHVDHNVRSDQFGSFPIIS